MKTVSEYIAFASAEHQPKLEWISAIILACSPLIEEKIRYKIPFYDYCGRMFCYLNPLKNGNVDLGFCQGALLSNENGILETKNRTQIRTVEIDALDSGLQILLMETLQEALVVNEMLETEKKKKKNSKK